MTNEGKRIKIIYGLDLEEILDLLRSDEIPAVFTSTGSASEAVVAYEMALEDLRKACNKENKRILEVEKYLFAVAGWSKAGLRERAYQLRVQTIDDYEKAGNFVDAARAAEKLGLTERANQLYVKAVDDYVEKEDYARAVYLARDVGLIERVNPSDVQAVDDRDKALQLKLEEFDEPLEEMNKDFERRMNKMNEELRWNWFESEY